MDQIPAQKRRHRHSFTRRLFLAWLVALLCLCLPPAASAAPPEMVLQISSSSPENSRSWAARAPVFASGDFGSVSLWDTRTWELRRVLNTSVGKVHHPFNFHGGDGLDDVKGVNAVALAPDGKTIAVCASDYSARIYDVATGGLRRILSRPGEQVFAVHFTPDEQAVAGSELGQMRVWQARTGKLLYTLKGTGEFLGSSQGRLLAAMETGAVNTPDQAIELRDIRTERLLETFTDGVGVYGPVVLSPNGRFLATGGENPDWQPPEGGPFSPAAYSHAESVKLWDAHTGKRLLVLPGIYNEGRGQQSLAFTPDSRTLVSGLDFQTQCWNVADGKERGAFPARAVTGLSPDGRTLVDGLNIWRLSRFSGTQAIRARRIHQLPPAPPSVEALVFSPDGRQFASGDLGQDGAGAAIKLWDIDRGTLVYSWPQRGSKTDIAFLPDGQAVMNNDYNYVQIWDTRTGRLRRLLSDPPLNAPRDALLERWISLSLDGKTLVSGGSDANDTLWVWDTATGTLRRKIEGVDQWLATAVLSPDGRFLANVTMLPSGKNRLKVWDLQTGATVLDVPLIAYPAATLIFSPDSKMLLSRTAVWFQNDEKYVSGKIQAWRLSDVHLAQTLANNLAFHLVQFSADGKTLTCVVSGRVNVYDAASFTLLQSTATAEFPHPILAISPEGRFLLTGGNEGIQIWEIASSRLRLTLLNFPSGANTGPSSNWIAYTPSGRYDASPGALAYLRWRVGNRLYLASAFAKRFQQPGLLQKVLRP